MFLAIVLYFGLQIISKVSCIKVLDKPVVLLEGGENLRSSGKEKGS
jgi:hypothetical protein